MATVSIFSGAFCQADDVARKVSGQLNHPLIDDDEVFSIAAQRFGIPASRFARTSLGKTSVFNKFTHEQERTAAFLKVVLADLLQKQDSVICGRAAKAIPSSISHVLSVCLVGDNQYRAEMAMAEKGCTQMQAEKLIARDDEGLFTWSHLVTGGPPWDAQDYDIFLPMGKNTPDQAAEIIVQNSKKAVLLPTPESLAALNDFALAAHVEVALVKEGHHVDVEVKEGRAVLTINKHSLMLAKLEDELKKIAGSLSGVKSVETTVGPGFHKADIYRRYDFEAPSRVLLVDDEQEFVQTLSDRLLMRDVGSAVVYDGQQALDFIAEEEPEVMVLDLNMPGMDGIEVLRRVKKQHPGIEIIILTGHGSQKDKDLCMEIGAFAYLEKPVDIEVLAEKMREANKMARARRQA